MMEQQLELLDDDINNRTNLIVNYLPQTLTDDEFRSMFLSLGPVKSSKIVRDRASGYSYGFGFVEYVKEEDALNAIQTLNGLQLQNKRLKVAFSRSGEDIKGANLYVRNIPKTMTQDDLEALFALYGTIVQARILTEHNSGQSKGVGFVLFEKRNHAEQAVNEMDGHIPEGSTEPLSVKYAEDNKGKARAPQAMGMGGMGRGSGRGAGAGAGAAAAVGAAQGGWMGGAGNAAPFGRGRGASSYGGGYAGGGGYGGGYAPGPVRNQSQNRFRYNPMNGSGYPSAGGASLNGGSGGGGDGGGFILFVYNIGPNADESELWQLFAPYGNIAKVNVIRDFQKNMGKGYGFVTMTNYQDAMNAIQQLNGLYYHGSGKNLQVSFKTNKN